MKKINNKSRLLKRVLFALSSMLFFQSCTNSPTRALNGFWTIESLIYEGLESNMCLYSNGISFHNPNVKLPTTGKRCEGLVVYEEEGVWEFKKTDSIPLLIHIQTNNDIFSGDHQVVFRKDLKRKLLQVEFRSNELHMIASKALFNFDRNISFIDALVELSTPVERRLSK